LTSGSHGSEPSPTYTESECRVYSRCPGAEKDSGQIIAASSQTCISRSPSTWGMISGSGSNREDCSSQSRLQHALHLRLIASDPVPASCCRFASTTRCGDGRWAISKNPLVTLPALEESSDWRGSKLACVPLLGLKHHHQSHHSNGSPPFEMPVRFTRPGSREDPSSQ
jgi:hypothetical protein